MNDFSCEPNPTLIPIEINTCYKVYAEDRRQGCLQTWMPRLSRKFLPVFVAGNPNLEVPFKYAPPFLIVRAGNNHDSVSAKVHGFLSWALSRFELPWYFKCDDDTYVNAKVFNDFPFQDYDYVGRLYSWDYGNTDINHPQWKAHGAGYSLSRRCAEKVLAEIDPTFPCEDVQVGRIVKTIPDLKYRNQNTDDAKIAPWCYMDGFKPGWMLGHPIYGVEQMGVCHQRVYPT